MSISVLSAPGPPAFVTIARRGPRGRGCLASTSAILKSSPIVSTRRTPTRRNAASNTSSLPVSAPVCEAAALDAASHTGALTGSDEVLDAAFRRVGVLRVDTIGELFNMAEVLAKQPRPRGPRLAIVTNAGGPGALSTDMLIRGSGQLAALSPETRASLDGLLPAHWSHANPVDILGDADADRYEKAVE